MIVDFLKENWSYISSSLIIVLTFIALIIKKRPKTFDDLKSVVNELTTTLPGLITAVECPGHGPEKKEAVLTACIKRLPVLLGRDLTDSEERMAKNTLSLQIEKILMTPTKKED